MSLLKTKRNKYTTKASITYFNDFKKYYKSYVLAPTKEDFKGMLHSYTAFSLCYLIAVADTLQPFDSNKQQMTIMNSILVEVAHELEIPYFNREKGFSIIDKSISYVLDNGIPKTFQYLDFIIEEMSQVEIDDSTD